MGEPERLPRIFDRARAEHRWLRAFGELEEAGRTWQAVIANWRMDHRVSGDRELRMLNGPHFAGEPGGGTWQRQRREAFAATLCRPARVETGGQRSAYLEATNANNTIPRRVVPTHEQLVHVGSLNRILSRLATAELRGAADLRLRLFELTGRDFPQRTVGEGLDHATFGQDVDRLATSINKRGQDAVRRLAGELCQALGDSEPPWWAGFAHELVPRLRGADATGLCQALGVGHLARGEWLIVWRYEVGEIYRAVPGISLRRPTVVEAGESPFHFPSPPGYTYGITMLLVAGDRRGACREVLHPPLRGEVAASACTGTLLQLKKQPVGYDEISELRRRHRRRLEKAHPQSETTDWLDRHLSL